jgi:hypothetical protein
MRVEGEPAPPGSYHGVALDVEGTHRAREPVQMRGTRLQASGLHSHSVYGVMHWEASCLLVLQTSISHTTRIKTTKTTIT